MSSPSLVNIAIVVMMAIMMVQASLLRVLQRPLDQINNPAVFSTSFSKRTPGPIAFNPSAENKKEENFEIPTVQAEGVTDDGSLARTKRHHKGGYYGGYNRGGYYGYRYPYFSYNNGYHYPHGYSGYYYY